MRCIHWFFLAFAVLVFPVIFLLFAQWPLRDLVQAGSRLANDMGQLAFGVYVATAVTAASVAGTHLACHLPGAQTDVKHSGRLGAWRNWAVFSCVAPWAIFILVSDIDRVLRSVQLLERFPDTGHPGFFILQMAVLWMAALVLIHAVWTLALPWLRRGEK